jgi:hypothetical protein
MIFLYLTLLLAGVGLFVLSYVAQFRLASLLRQRYPQHWQIIAESTHGKASARARLCPHAARAALAGAAGAGRRQHRSLAQRVALQSLAGLAQLAGRRGHAPAAAMNDRNHFERRNSCNWI